MGQAIIDRHTNPWRVKVAGTECSPLREGIADERGKKQYAGLGVTELRQ